MSRLHNDSQWERTDGFWLSSRLPGSVCTTMMVPCYKERTNIISFFPPLILSVFPWLWFSASFCLLCNSLRTQTEDSWVPRFLLREVNFSRRTHEPSPPARSWRNSSLSGGLSMGLHLGVWSPAMGPGGVCARGEIIHGSSCGPSPFCTDYILIYLVMSDLCVRWSQSVPAVWYNHIFGD